MDKDHKIIENYNNKILILNDDENENNNENIVELGIIDIMNECPICIEEFSKDYDYTITKCLHKFHNSCIIKHIHRVNHNCPVCRSELLTININLNVNGTRIRDQQITRPNDPPDYNMIYSFILQLVGTIKVIVVYSGTFFIIYTMKLTIVDIVVKTSFIYFTAAFTNWFFNTAGLFLIISYTFFTFLNSIRNQN